MHLRLDAGTRDPESGGAETVVHVRHESCYSSTSLGVVGRWTWSLGGFARSIRKSSCAGKSSKSENSSYRSSAVMRKAATREPGRAFVREALRSLAFGLDLSKRLLRWKASLLEIRTDVRIAVAAIRKTCSSQRGCPF